MAGNRLIDRSIERSVVRGKPLSGAPDQLPPGGTMGYRHFSISNSEAGITSQLIPHLASSLSIPHFTRFTLASISPLPLLRFRKAFAGVNLIFSGVDDRSSAEMESAMVKWTARSLKIGKKTNRNES